MPLAPPPRLRLLAALAASLLVTAATARAQEAEDDDTPQVEDDGPQPELEVQVSPSSAASEAPPAPTGEPDELAAEPGAPTGRARALLAELERDRAEPRAFAVLAELAGLEDEASDLAPFTAAYERVASDPKAHPEVRAFAGARLAALARARGDLAGARAAEARLGFLETWTVAGPFDNEGKRGHDEVYPPERAQDLSQRFPGKVREVGWRVLPREVVSRGFVSLGTALRPGREVTAYALAVLETPRPTRARLYVGASGAVKVFVNGALVLQDPSYHAPRLDQGAVELTLPQGANRVLVKLSQADGPFGFYARLTDAAGGPLRLAPATAPLRPAPRGALSAKHLPGVVELLEARARAAKGPDAATAQLDLVRALAARRPGEDRERRALAAARTAVALAPQSLRARMLLARLEDDPNRRREALEAALTAAPRAGGVLTALARFEAQRGRSARAWALLDQADAAAPGAVPGALLRAELLEGSGLAARAAMLREETARAHPRSPAALKAAARAARAIDRLDESERWLRAALALRRDDGDARAALAQLRLDRGDVEGAIALIKEGLEAEPGDLASRLRLARLEAANGRGEAAEAEYAHALRIAPEEAETLERRGEARLRAGRTADALADFHAALELRPQNARLKERVRAIEPAGERFETPYLQDARALARAALDPQPGEDAVVLSELRVSKVYPSGLSSSYLQLVVKVLNARGVDAWRSWATGYTPDRQELKVDRARVLKPDGTSVESFGERDVSASEPWYRLYYDTRARQLTFPALAPGDVLELAVRTDDVAGENLLSDYFGQVVFLGDVTRKLRAEYVLLSPASRRIFESALPANVTRTERALDGGVTERRFLARDLPRVKGEPGMPGWSEVAPWIHVSTYASWADVGRFYWGLVREQLAVTPEVRDTALRIAAEVKRERRAASLPEDGDGRALVEAVHRFVVTNTRYVGLELGIHGYKPYRVDQILERRFGDCKDKASLTHALLEALGIDARLVLLRMKRLGRIPEAPASLAVFNHAITYVPAYDLWLDGTASYSGTHDLPGEDRGASVLVVNPDGPSRFGVIPEGRPEDNESRVAYQVALRPDGSAEVTGVSQVKGARAPSYRMAYAAEHDRRAQLESAMSGVFPGVKVKAVRISELSRLEDDVALDFDLELARLAERQGGVLRLGPFGASQRFAEALAPLSSRQFDLVLDEPWEARFSWRYVLPAGWKVEDLPAPAHGDDPTADFEVSYRAEPGALVAEGRLRVKVGRVAAGAYPGFRSLLAAADRAMARPVRLAPDPAAPRASR